MEHKLQMTSHHGGKGAPSSTPLTIRPAFQPALRCMPGALKLHAGPRAAGSGTPGARKGREEGTAVQAVGAGRGGGGCQGGCGGEHGPRSCGVTRTSDRCDTAPSQTPELLFKPQQ